MPYTLKKTHQQRESSYRVIQSYLTPVSTSTEKSDQTSENRRAFSILYNKAEKLTENFTLNEKIWYSGCQGQIEDLFWKTVKKNPTEFIIEDKPDEIKLKETYKFSARSLGVRIW